MRRQKGITLIALTITIVVMMIIAGITVYIGKDLIAQTKLQDLRTNMLLIQAKTKEGLEEASFQKITEIKDAMNNELIIGKPVKDSNEISEIYSTLEIPGKEIYKIENCFYLDKESLESIGLRNLNVDDYGYFIVEYDFENTKVEVINTKGFQGNYTLEQINKLSEEQ